jgi:protein-S-isoprenylcysteine O-methyltransferase Ste14
MRKIIPGFLIAFLISILCLIVVSGKWDWWEGWLLALVTNLTTIGGRILLIKKHPDLATERANYKEQTGVQAWDKKLMPIVAIFGPLSIWIAAGLNKRFVSTGTLPASIEIAAFILISVAYIFSTWAMLENQFFAAVVRIQKDRQHQVIEGGPYRVVRHPGYAGSFIATLFIPLALSTYWAYIPVVLTNIILCIRTAKEDHFLLAELPGYADYATRTLYRLIPGIW